MHPIGAFVELFGRSVVGISLVIVVFSASLLVYIVSLDFFSPQGREYGSGRFASESELRVVLAQCGINSPEIRKAGFLIKRGLGWDGTGFPGVQNRLRCIDGHLRSANRTAGVIGEWD